MHPSYYHQAHACLLVFDVTRKVTYQNLARWYKELREYREDIPCIVVANKIDANIAMYVKSRCRCRFRCLCQLDFCVRSLIL